MSHTSRILIAVVVVLAALLVLARVRYSGKAPVKLAAQQCDATLWDHVYDKERLEIIEPCTAVEGRVVSVHQTGSDGDAEILLEPATKSALNLLNVIHNRGQLVTEIVCHHAPRREAAKPACANYRPEIMLPQAGDRVRITGSYVTDRDYGWREIHPVTRIERLP